MKITKTELYSALKDSLEIQSFYAMLLNSYDSGLRKEFKSPEEWIARLRALKTGLMNGKTKQEKRFAV